MNLLKTIAFWVISSTTIVETAHAQTADEILEKHITAIGGRDNWNKIHSIAMKGVLAVGGQVADFSTTVVDEVGFRQDFTLMGVTGYKIITHTAGWMYMPGTGNEEVRPLSPEEVYDGQGQLSVKGNLIDYKSRGVKVEYLGKEKTEGQDCFKLKVTEKGGNEEWLYISQRNYYLVSSLKRVKINDRETDIATVYRDYEMQPEGIVIATTVSARGSDIHFTIVEINKPVDQSTFKPTVVK